MEDHAILQSVIPQWSVFALQFFSYFDTNLQANGVMRRVRPPPYSPRRVSSHNVIVIVLDPIEMRVRWMSCRLR